MWTVKLSKQADLFLKQLSGKPEKLLGNAIAKLSHDPFLSLARRNQELGESFIILKDGEPVSALLPFEEYEALLETLDILESKPHILKKLK